MLKRFLQYDYCLSEWFASSNERVLSGVSFIFSGKVVFLFLPVYFALEHWFSFELSINLFMGGLIISLILIMYTLYKAVPKLVRAYDLRREYKYLSKGEKRKRNFIGLSLVIIVYFGSLYVLLTKVLIW